MEPHEILGKTKLGKWLAKVGNTSICVSTSHLEKQVCELIDFNLTARDHDLLRTLRTLLKVEGRDTFIADDLYLLRLDRFFPDPTHDVGGFLARLQHNKLIVPNGEKRSVRPSNHMRRIRVFRLVNP